MPFCYFKTQINTRGFESVKQPIFDCIHKGQNFKLKLLQLTVLAATRKSVSLYNIPHQIYVPYAQQIFCIIKL